MHADHRTEPWVKKNYVHNPVACGMNYSTVIVGCPVVGAENSRSTGELRLAEVVMAMVVVVHCRNM